MRNYYTGVHTAMWDNSTKARGDWDNKYQRYWGLKKQVGNTAETNHEQQDKETREVELNVKHRWQKTTKVKEEIHNQLTTDSNI